MFSVFLELNYKEGAFSPGLNVILPEAGSAFLPAVCFPQLLLFKLCFQWTGFHPIFNHSFQHSMDMKYDPCWSKIKI